MTSTENLPIARPGPAGRGARPRYDGAVPPGPVWSDRARLPGPLHAAKQMDPDHPQYRRTAPPQEPLVAEPGGEDAGIEEQAKNKVFGSGCGGTKQCAWCRHNAVVEVPTMIYALRPKAIAERSCLTAPSLRGSCFPASVTAGTAAGRQSPTVPQLPGPWASFSPVFLGEWVAPFPNRGHGPASTFA